MRPGWVQPVGITRLTAPLELKRLRTSKLLYTRVELHNVLLSHAGALFLLQGASLRQLLTDVTLWDKNILHFYSVISADPPCLWRPPPVLPRVVLARLIERPVDMPPEEIFRELFLAETSTTPLLLAPPLGVQQGVRRTHGDPLNRDNKPTTEMPAAPFVDPRVLAQNPAAAAYARSLQDRQALPKYSEPRGGGSSPPIPRLDGPHQDGMTMADQARAQQGPPEPAPQPQGTIFSPEAAARAMASQQNGILQNDVLPEAARQDPLFRDGHGAMYAVHQPNLARKYGVIRSGKHILPQMLEQGRPGGLKPSTVEGLEAVAAFNKQRQEAEVGNTAAESAAKDGMAAQAARLANPSGGDDVAPITDEQRRQADRAMKSMDDFDFNNFREVLMKDLLNNDDQRKIVEERLEPLDLSELIMNGMVQQLIPIIPGKYEPTLQSCTGEEELALKRILMEETKGLETPDRYLLDKFQLMTVALCLVKINKTQLPEHRDKNGNFSAELFWNKFNRVIKFPFHLLASIGVHYYWFDIRVRKLFVAEKIKNG